MQPDIAGDRRRLLLGLAASMALVTIWGSGPAVTRLGMRQLDWQALALLRFGIPALLLLPVAFRVGLRPRGISWPMLAIMVVTSGVGYFVFSALALRLAPVAEVGPLLAGTTPLFVALWAILGEKKRFNTGHSTGFILIGIGVFAIAGVPIIQRGDVNLGHLLGLIAALSWAVYAVYFGRGAISALAATAVFSVWSTLLLLPFCLIPLLAAFETVPFSEIALQAAVQGVAIGLVSVLLFGESVRLLGAPQSAAFSAMTPVLAALIAIPMLGEWPSVPAALAIAAITAGVILTSWPSRSVAPPAA